MPLSGYACEHCGFWQRWFGVPAACPVCSDVRNDLPPDGWSFAGTGAVAARVRTAYAEPLPGVYGLTTTPAIGLGGTGWLVVRPEGNIAFEAAAWHDAAALARIAELGGVRFASASHPHGCGALWQLQDHFAPELALHKDGLAWSKAFRVTLPYDDEIELAPGVTLRHLGGHYEGHALLHVAGLQAIFCGDAIKIDHDARGNAIAVSAHKAYHKEIPLTRNEIRHYRDVLAACSFAHTFTTFDYAPLGRERLLAFFDVLATSRPSTRPVAL